MIGHDETTNPDLKIWDTRHESARDAFATYREGLCCARMPWGPEFRSEEPFEARLELLKLGGGNIVRVVQTSPHVTVRNRTHIARSDGECYLLTFSLSHKWSFEQSRQRTQGGPGDLVIFDSAIPTVARQHNSAIRVNTLGLMIPKQMFCHIPNANDRFRNLAIPSANIPAPLANSLWLLADNIISAHTEEMRAIYDACVSLVPVAAGVWPRQSQAQVAANRRQNLIQEVRRFVERNLSQSSLNAKTVAASFNVSDRYVHKLFAEAGTTFGNYVTLRRLQNVRRELESRQHASEPIFQLAYKWGFADITTFNRAFKRQFRCAPSRMRCS